MQRSSVETFVATANAHDLCIQSPMICKPAADMLREKHEASRSLKKPAFDAPRKRSGFSLTTREIYWSERLKAYDDKAQPN